jgi:hypothetical protein
MFSSSKANFFFTSTYMAPNYWCICGAELWCNNWRGRTSVRHRWLLPASPRAPRRKPPRHLSYHPSSLSQASKMSKIEKTIQRQQEKYIFAVLSLEACANICQNRGRPILRSAPTTPCNRLALRQTIELGRRNRYPIQWRTIPSQSRSRRFWRRLVYIPARCV